MPTKLGILGVPQTDYYGGPQNYVLNFYEAFQVDDVFASNLDNHDLAANVNLGLQDTYQISMTYNRSFADGFDVAGDGAKTPGKLLDYAFNVTESMVRVFGKALTDILVFQALMQESSAHSFTDDVTFAVTFEKVLTRVMYETFAVMDEVEYPLWVKERFDIFDVMLRTITAERNFTDGLDFEELFSPLFLKVFPTDVDYGEGYDIKLTRRFTESLAVIDTLLRNTNAVIFDLILRDDVLNSQELEENADSPPVGYTPFKTFYPGDYRFRKTISGVRITGAQNEGQAGIIGLTHVVDVPDITDRGTATVTGAEALGTGEHTVTFAKAFTAAPEVYITWTDGPTAALPELVSVTTSGFVFILRDISSPATVVEGSVSWAALGR